MSAKHARKTFAVVDFNKFITSSYSTFNERDCPVCEKKRSLPFVNCGRAAKENELCVVPRAMAICANNNSRLPAGAASLLIGIAVINNSPRALHRVRRLTTLIGPDALIRG